MDSEVDVVGGEAEGARRPGRQGKAAVGEGGGREGPVEKVGLEAEGDRPAHANEEGLANRGGQAPPAIAAEEGPIQGPVSG